MGSNTAGIFSSTASGAATGASVGGPWGAVIGGAIGLAGGIAQSQQNNAQQDMANAGLAQQQATRAQTMQFLAPSPQELQQLQQSISVNNTKINQNQALIDSSDPALLEVGKQTLALLQGKQAGIVEPLMQQRAQQRAQLENQLRQQFGSGYASSSAGIQALNQFDQQTAQTAQNAQFTALNQLLPQNYNNATMGQQGIQQGIANSSGLAAQYGAIGVRQAQGLAGAPITMAGSPFLGSWLNGQSTGQNLQGLMGSTAGIVSGAKQIFGSNGSDQAPVTTGTPVTLSATNTDYSKVG